MYECLAAAAGVSVGVETVHVAGDQTAAAAQPGLKPNTYSKYSQILGDQAKFAMQYQIALSSNISLNAQLMSLIRINFIDDNSYGIAQCKLV